MSKIFKIIITIFLIMPGIALAADDFSEIDRHALAAPQSAEQSMETLAAYLTKPAKNDLEAIRAIYRWITENIVYDTEEYFHKSEKARALEENALKTKSAICEGYSGLLEELAKAAGLEVVKIDGYGKGYDYLAGSGFSGPPNHAWNAVKINNQWFLLDSTWGAGYINDDRQYVKHFEEHYFLTRPEDFIFDHFPLDAKWQLIKRPISQSEYENLVYVKPAFFNCGLKIKSHHQSVIPASGRLEIKLESPENIWLRLNLEENGQKLKDQLVFVQKNGVQNEIFVDFPKDGSYLLRIFAKEKDKPVKYDWALDYGILVKNLKPVAIGQISFPKAYHDFLKNNAYLFSPRFGELKTGSKEFFKLKVPGALEVSVVMGGKFFRLKKDGEIFEKELKIKPGSIEVSAKFSKGKFYEVLLEYQGI